MTDPYRRCVHCQADCYVDDPAHAGDCPQTTGLFPAELGHCCTRCHTELDVYVCLPIADTDLLEVCCVGCAALAVY